MKGSGATLNPASRPAKRDAVALVERDDLGEQDARLLHEVVAGLARDRHAERTQVLRAACPRRRRRQRLVLGSLRDAEAAARADLREPRGRRRARAGSSRRRARSRPRAAGARRSGTRRRRGRARCRSRARARRRGRARRRAARAGCRTSSPSLSRRGLPSAAGRPLHEAPARGFTRIPTVAPGARRPHRSSCERRSRFTWTPLSTSSSTSDADRFVPVKLISSTDQPFASACRTSPGEHASIPTEPRPRTNASTSGSRWALSASRSRNGAPARSNASIRPRACSPIRGRS